MRRFLNSLKRAAAAVLQYVLDLAAAWKQVAGALLGAIVLILVGVYATTAAVFIFTKAAGLTAIAGVPWGELVVVLLGVPLVVFLGQIAIKLVPRAVVLAVVYMAAFVVGIFHRLVAWYTGTSAVPTPEQEQDASNDPTLGRWPADTWY